jgi:hypothetical protein
MVMFRDYARPSFEDADVAVNSNDCDDGGDNLSDDGLELEIEEYDDDFI